MADLRYKVVVDDAEAKRKLSELLKGTGVSGSNEIKAQASNIESVSVATNKLKEAQLANIEALRQARLEQMKHKREISALQQAYLQGKINAQQFTLEQKKLAAAQKEAARIAKETKKALADNSEYGKLTKALNNVRKETKDVLAEMFKLERRGHATGAAYQALKEKAEALTKQTQYLDNAVKRIDATVGQHQRNVGNYKIALEGMVPIISRVNLYLANFGTSIDALASKPNAFRELGSSIAALGRQFMTFVASPVGLAITALGGLFALFQANKRTVIDFNSGLRDVSKTTGIAGQDLTDFGDAIIDLSMKLKVVDATKLLEYATVAGQLGVKGRANILAFTEALAMLETASDIKGEEGAANIARMLTLVDGGVQSVKAFGDEIVNLGNNFAATESEILSNATLIAQNVGIYRIGRQEVLAFATATKAVGLEAELVGSTFSRTLGEMEKSLRTGKGIKDLLKVIGGTAEDLQRRFREDAAGVFVDYIRGLNEISKSGGSVNEALERTGIIAVRDQRVIASLATNGYEVLVDALEKVKEAQGAMQAEFENGASKLEQQTKRMGIAWDNFVLSIENGEGVIGRSVVAIIGWFAELLDQINKTFNPTSIDEFTARFMGLDFKKADLIRELNLAFDDANKSAEAILNTTPTSKSMNNLLLETESTIKQLTGAYNKYKAAVNEGVLTDGGKAKLKDFEGILDLLQKKQSQLILLGARLPGTNTNNSGGNVDFELSDAERRKREVAQRAAERKAEQGRQALERQRKLQLEIDALAEKATRKQIDRNQEEIASIKDKYAKMREEVRKFYADPRNKGLKVDMGKLVQAENFEISEAKFRQQTRVIMTALNEQKSIYKDFYSFVEQHGQEAAEAAFGDLSELAKSYKDQLNKEYWELLSIQKKASAFTFQGENIEFTQAQEERLRELESLLEEIAREEIIRQRNKFAEMLKLSSTTESKIHEIRERYAKAFEELEAKKTEFTEAEYNKRKEALKKAQAEELGNVLLPQLKSNDNWINVFEKSSTIARDKVKQSAELLKAELNKILKEGKISAEQYRDIINQIREVEIQISINDRGFARLKAIIKELREAEKGSVAYDEARRKLGEEINYWGQGVASIGDELKNIFDQLNIGSEKFREDLSLTMDVVSNASNAAASFASGDYIGAVVNTIKTIGSVINLFSKDRKIERKIKDYQGQLEALGNTYDKLVRKMSDSDTDYYKKSDAVLKNLQEQEKVLKQMLQAEESKKKTDKEKVNSYKNSIQQIQQARADLEASIREMRLQTDVNNLAKSITDALVGAFEAGEKGIESMEKAFDDFIKQSLANSARLNFVQGIIEEMLNDVDKYMSGNNDSLIGYNFSLWQQKLENAGKQVYDFLESAYEGLGLEKDINAGGDSTIAGRLSAQLTEKTGSEFVGILRAGYSMWEKQLQTSLSQESIHKQHLEIAMENLSVFNSINENTANTVKRLDTVVEQLSKVVKNTSSGRTTEGMGL